MLLDLISKTLLLQINLPFVVMADKMTTRHLTQYMVRICIPIWDMRSSYLSKDMYSVLPLKMLEGEVSQIIF